MWVDGGMTCNKGCRRACATAARTISIRLQDVHSTRWAVFFKTCMCVCVRETMCVCGGVVLLYPGTVKVVSQTLRSIPSRDAPQLSLLFLSFTFTLGFYSVSGASSPTRALCGRKWRLVHIIHQIRWESFSPTHTHLLYIHSRCGNFNSKLPTPSAPPFLSADKLQLCMQGSRHPQSLMFPPLPPNTSKPIHCSQYSKSHNNKGVTLWRRHSYTDARVQVGVWWNISVIDDYCDSGQNKHLPEEKLN